MNESIYYDLKQGSGLAPSLATQVAREIGRRVVSGTYAQGDLVEDEGSLASRYQVSRSVIRDAVKILVGKGLLEVRRGIGTRVRDRSFWGMLDNDVLAWYQSAPPDADLLNQLMDIRDIMEPNAARWAAERASDDDIDELRLSLEKMEAACDSPVDFVTADAAFHQAVLQAARNEFLVAMEGIIFSALLSSIRLTNNTPERNRESTILHRQVYDAIAARDADQAEHLMKNLLSDAKRRLHNRFSDSDAKDQQLNQAGSPQYDS